MITVNEAIVRLAQDLADQEENPVLAEAYRNMAKIYKRRKAAGRGSETQG